MYVLASDYKILPKHISKFDIQQEMKIIICIPQGGSLMGDITIFGQNLLNLKFEPCVHKFLNRQLKETLVVILR